MTRAFYNEIDPAAAHVLRAMIADGHIAPGDVDERSIKDLKAHDLQGYTQCHFFAGGGFWSVAARLAEWPDDKPLWSASCPCQPFSQAGKGGGVDDPRHLWPDVDRLVREARTSGQHVPVIVGEQVGGSDGYDWFNGVRTDLEGQGYETFVADTPACAVDAPHIRQRLYWVAVANAQRTGSQGQVHGLGEVQGSGRQGAADQLKRRNELDRSDVGNAISESGQRYAGSVLGTETKVSGEGEFDGHCANGLRSANGSFWSDHEWIICHDGKARRTKRSVRHVADGVPGCGGTDNTQSLCDYSLIVPAHKGRTQAWKITGNAIVPVLAAQVLGALLDTEEELKR